MTVVGTTSEGKVIARRVGVATSAASVTLTFSELSRVDLVLGAYPVTTTGFVTVSSVTQTSNQVTVGLTPIAPSSGTSVIVTVQGA